MNRLSNEREAEIRGYDDETLTKYHLEIIKELLDEIGIIRLKYGIIKVDNKEKKEEG